MGYISVIWTFVSNTLMYFIFSFLTIGLSVLTILLFKDTNITQILISDTIISSLAGAIPCYLIAMYYGLEVSNKKTKKFILLLLIISIALFGIANNIGDVVNKKLFYSILYGMLIISIFLTFFYQEHILELKQGWKSVRDDNQIGEDLESSSPTGPIIVEGAIYNV